MTRFEKLLQFMLNSGPPARAGLHLTADQLSIFVERGGRGRDVVIEHASRCAECRDALFLMSGEQVAPAPPSLVRKWHWALVAAAGVACAFAILTLYYFDRAVPAPPAIFAKIVPPAPIAIFAKIVPPAPINIQAVVSSKKPAPRAAARMTLSPQYRVLKPPLDFPPRQAFFPASINAVQMMPQRSFIWTVRQGVAEQSADSGLSWRAIPIDSSVYLESIGSLSNQVWAGGTKGALFHSSDNGGHWEMIFVAQGDQRLTSNVVEIQVVSELRVELRASNGQRWLTGDGGQTWKCDRS